VDGLGRAFDLAVGGLNVDVQAGALTGNRVALRDASALTVVLLAGFTGTVDALNVTLRQHSAASGGSSADLVAIDRYYLKSAVALAGTEPWVEVTQTLSASLTAFGTAAHQKLVAFEVAAEQLSDGFGFVSLNVPDQGAAVGTKVASVLYVLHGLVQERAPHRLRASL
jgi:uncharacterized protein YybS (DUF2232 family)